MYLNQKYQQMLRLRRTSPETLYFGSITGKIALIWSKWPLQNLVRGLGVRTGGVGGYPPCQFILSLLTGRFFLRPPYGNVGLVSAI